MYSYKILGLVLAFGMAGAGCASNEKLIDRTLKEFSGMLASTSSTPGGGSGAALNALEGASFIAMVAGITAEKPDFADMEPELRLIIGETEKLRSLFLRLIDEDSLAYERFVSAMASGAGASELKAALRGCIIPPFELLDGSVQALRLARELSSRYYLPTASDVGIAALNLETAARGAYLTVCINLKGDSFDADEKAEYREKSLSLLAEAEEISKEIYDSVKIHVEN
ncbi:MAG: cyclodeaminase/cyclohydrolase family protein [Spirochaetaceae bacterium]|jgi:formiminotetrahydrofolate cyclodeaminase|nr:cyclodeaminase/cyclohydrolase family protein [Spirochaetaceae bacterium]